MASLVPDSERRLVEKLWAEGSTWVVLSRLILHINVVQSKHIDEGTEDRMTTTIDDALIDACAYHDAVDDDELVSYLPSGWKSYLTGGFQSSKLQLHGGAFSVIPPQPLIHPRQHAEAAENGRTASADPERLVRDHVAGHCLDKVVLHHGLARAVPGAINAPLAFELTRAANRLTAERWLPYDDRLFATHLVATQSPTEAAADIGAAAGNPRIVGVLLAANGLGKPFGHPAYRPIIDAAADSGLPLVLHVGGDESADVLSASTSGGRANTFTDQYLLASQSVTTHVVSLVAQGVFERHPDLKVLVLGAGVTWLTPMVWRFETNFKAMRRQLPWLSLTPWEYVHRNVRVGTHPFTGPADDDALRAYLTAQDGMREILTFASGYPSWDRDGAPDAIVARLPDGWEHNVRSANARDVFRFPSAVPLTTSGSAPGVAA